MRWNLLWALLGILPDLALAQPPQHSEVPVTRLTLKPASAPTPPILHELLPNPRDQLPVNAALGYHRAMLMLRELARTDAKIKSHAKIDDMLSKTVNDELLRAMNDDVAHRRNVLRELEFASRGDRCDWGLEPIIDADGIGALLPEIQSMREIGTLLSIRCRLHIAHGEAAEALRDVRTGFAMSRNIAEGPTLIQALVGFAVFQMFAERLEQTLELPNCPNMYWSLTALPRPFVDLRKPMEGEIRMMEASLPMLRGIEKPMSAAQAQTALDAWTRLTDGISRTAATSATNSRIKLAAQIALHYPGAKETLRKLGKTEVELDAMPASQVVLLESLLLLRSVRDEMFVWFNAPYPEAAQGLQRVEDKVRKLRIEASGDIFRSGLLESLTALPKIHFASVRVERRIALLRCIEAMRLHAAANGGKLPASLSEIVVVPLPLDPVTAKAFDYELTKDGKALLSAPTPKGQQPNSSNTPMYELTLKR